MKKLITWLYYRYVRLPEEELNNLPIIYREWGIVERDEVAHAYYERQALRHHGIRVDH